MSDLTDFFPAASGGGGGGGDGGGSGGGGLRTTLEAMSGGVSKIQVESESYMSL